MRNSTRLHEDTFATLLWKPDKNQLTTMWQIKMENLPAFSNNSNDLTSLYTSSLAEGTFYLVS